MASANKIKMAFAAAFTVVFFGWAVSGTVSTVFSDPVDPEYVQPELIANAGPEDYVGSASCKECHEDAFRNFANTKHAKLKDVASWKDKVQGCESCHGPGKKHLEDATNPNAIISFKKKNSKFISESCLTCHAGKESHNNYRRGEHWRSDVSCIDCHSPHAAPFEHEKAGSVTFVNDVSRENPNRASTLRLKARETQLCMSCHTDTRSQFSKPFHHKVLEGTMKCSDCHNPHGGFEAKQAKLAVGADVSCLKCHAEKQGPFVFEHAPLKTEGCSACHTPHGSSNPKMLNRNSIRQTCMECHSSLSNAEGGAPQAPHNQTTARYQNCTICHAQIHGSNASKYFFR